MISAARFEALRLISSPGGEVRLTAEGHGRWFMDPEGTAVPGIPVKLTPMVGRGKNERNRRFPSAVDDSVSAERYCSSSFTCLFVELHNSRKLS